MSTVSRTWVTQTLQTQLKVDEVTCQLGGRADMVMVSQLSLPCGIDNRPGVGNQGRLHGGGDVCARLLRKN